MLFVGILLFVLFTAVGLPLVGALTGGIAFLTVAATMIGNLGGRHTQFGAEMRKISCGIQRLGLK